MVVVDGQETVPGLDLKIHFILRKWKSLSFDLQRCNLIFLVFLLCHRVFLESLEILRLLYVCALTFFIAFIACYMHGEVFFFSFSFFFEKKHKNFGSFLKSFNLACFPVIFLFLIIHQASPFSEVFEMLVIWNVTVLFRLDCFFCWVLKLSVSSRRVVSVLILIMIMIMGFLIIWSLYGFLNFFH